MLENSERENAMRECRKKIEMLERQLEDHEDLVAVESQQSAEIDRLNVKVNRLTKDFELKQREKDAQMTHYELVLGKMLTQFNFKQVKSKVRLLMRLDFSAFFVEK